MAGIPHLGHKGLWERCSHCRHRTFDGKGHNVSPGLRLAARFSLPRPGKGCAIGLHRDRGSGNDYFSFGGGGFSRDSSVLPASVPPGAQALECYSCVQKADDGCSPQKTKTVKCAPGMDVCTEVVGAVESSEWGLRVLAYSFTLLHLGPSSLWSRPSL